MKNWIFGIVILLLHVQVFAQSLSIQATVNDNEITVNDRIKFTVTIKNGLNAKDFRPPALTEHFRVLGGPSMNSFSQKSNGITISVTNYDYILQPKSAGRFTIGAAYIKSDSKTYSSSPITITVVDAPGATAAAASTTAPKPQPAPVTSDNLVDFVNQHVFMKAEVSDADVYKGENILVTWKLYVAQRNDFDGPIRYGDFNSPKFDGFYAEEVEFRDQQLKVETINGIKYNVITAKKTMLTPQRSGELLVDAYDCNYSFVVLTNASGSSNRPFQNGTKVVTLRIFSDELKINVTDLPPNTPDDFNGAVGKFVLQTQLNNTTTKTDEPLTYKITIAGSGNLELLSTPELNLPEGWDVYDPEVTVQNNTKVFSYLISPRIPGDFVIPEYSFSYLDPTTKKYTALKSESYTVSVTPGPGYDPENANFDKKKAAEAAAAGDIKPVTKIAPQYAKQNNVMAGNFLFYIFFLLPIIGSAGLFFYTYQMRNKKVDVVAERFNTADANAKKQLTKAAGFVTSDNARAFYDETIHALWQYTTDKLNIPKSELSKENITQLLIKKNVSANLAQGFTDLLDTCEMGLFAPQPGNQTLQTVYQQAVDIITQLENEIR
jgi:hypothetical protein